jgi:hypothetical protein
MRRGSSTPPGRGRPGAQRRQREPLRGKAGRNGGATYYRGVNASPRHLATLRATCLGGTYAAPHTRSRTHAAAASSSVAGSRFDVRRSIHAGPLSGEATRDRPDKTQRGRNADDGSVGHLRRRLDRTDTTRTRRGCGGDPLSSLPRRGRAVSLRRTVVRARLQTGLQTRRCETRRSGGDPARRASRCR